MKASLGSAREHRRAFGARSAGRPRGARWDLSDPALDTGGGLTWKRAPKEAGSMCPREGFLFRKRPRRRSDDSSHEAQVVRSISATLEGPRLTR